MKEFLDIYWTFFKISAVTFGGGMTMFPILQREIVQNKAWITDEELLDYYAVSQSLPGIIAINIAAFIGYKKKGLRGEIISGLGIISPSVIIITILASFITNFKDVEIVRHAFAGITIGVSALLFSAVVNLWKKSMIDNICLALFLMTFVLMLLFNISPIIFVFVSAATGILVKNIGLKA